MNYTTNYHLPQWVESDRILMEDFNEAMEDIDGGIAAAKTAADTAQAAAETAQGTAGAAYSPDNKPYVVGTYAGNFYGAASINLGFRPSFLIIASMGTASSGSWADAFGYCVITAGGSLPDRVTFTDTGFTVASPGDGDPYPNPNDSRRTYEYIAFR